jgi:hypothetical protein
MADHRATWVRLRAVARQRYPDDDMAVEAAARALVDKEEAASYAADLDARAEEQDVLDTAHAATRLRGELREELWAEGSGTEEEYVHLDDADLDDDLDADDLAYLELPTDEEATESAAEQRALMASFETQRRRVCPSSHGGREKGGGERPGRGAPKRAPIGIPLELGGGRRAEGVSGGG